MAQFPTTGKGTLVTHFNVASDIGRSRRFYAGVLGGEVPREGEPSIIALANSWIIINVGGPPTDDKPTVTLEAPRDPETGPALLVLRYSLSAGARRVRLSRAYCEASGNVRSSWASRSGSTSASIRVIFPSVTVKAMTENSCPCGTTTAPAAPLTSAGLMNGYSLE
jgi:hypothetical protein